MDTEGDVVTELQIIEVEPQVVFFAPSEKELRWQYEEIFEHGCYQPVRIPTRGYVVDAGANVGLFTYFVKRSHPYARVCAFEPMPAAAEALRKNIAHHGLTDVTVHECALGAAREESVEFTYYPVLPGNSTRYPEQKALQQQVLSQSEPPAEVARQHVGHRVEAPVERLSAFLSEDRPVDLLKVDVEGAELEVLAGIDPEHWPLIHQVIAEVQDLDGRLLDFCELLHRQGLQPTVRPAPMIPAGIRTFLVHGSR